MGRVAFSANLGFLWSDIPLPDAIRAAKTAGFDAIECHWPYDFSAERIRSVLEETGLSMLGLNTRRGDVEAGENGLSALPGRMAEARDAIDEAVRYAGFVGASYIHAMAGNAQGLEASRAFVENLRYARAVAPESVTILIEPLNRYDAPGYFLETTEQAADILRDIGDPGVKLMFDCYHVARTEGDVLERLRALLPLVGHIQFATAPDRTAPDHGNGDYVQLFQQIAALGWDTPIGAEYKPRGATEDSLGWMKTVRRN